jgi:zinc protease
MIGGYRLLDSYVDRIRAVSAADVQRVARTYFPADRKNVGVLLPLP